MKTCRICGEQKDDYQFYRIKHFYKVMTAIKIWCRDCQKTYMEMKKIEKQKKEREQMQGTFSVSFT